MSYNCIRLFICFCFSTNIVITSEVTESSNIKDGLITTLMGRPIGDKTSSLTVGYHGPVLLEDTQLEEDIAHMNRERIPDRVAYAKGAGAFGVFQVTNPEITKYTKAKLFDSAAKITEVAVRFSTFSGERGSPDTVAGEPRGFAVKFYTGEKNWDLVGNNVPMYFIRDAKLFPSLVHANKRNPQSGLKDPTALWDFYSLRPETLNLITYLFSDYGIPDGYRHMPGFSINAYKLVNSANQHFYAKFHWTPNQGIKNLDPHTAERLRGIDPDYALKDLFNAIKERNFPSWTLSLQVIAEDKAKSFPFNPFDPTKIWPIDQFPLIEVGVMTLDKTQSNYHAEIEQLAFNPAHLIEGIEPSPDKLLKERLFHYGDAQQYRLKTNLNLIPVNEPRKRKVDLTNRDGFMRVDDNYGNLPNYYPNSFSKDGLKYLNDTSEAPEIRILKYDIKSDDHYFQARERYNSYPPDWKKRLHKNIAISLRGVLDFIIDRVLTELKKIHPLYADGVRAELERVNSKHEDETYSHVD